MTILQGSIIGPVYGGAGQTGLQCARCTYTGRMATGDLIVFGDTVLGTGLINNEYQFTLPQGTEPLDAILRLVDAGSSFNLEAGYAAADGSASTTNGVADVNASYFLTTQTMAATAIERANGPTTVVKLQRPTNPTVTVVAGDSETESTVELDVFYLYHGNDGANSVEDA